MASVWALRLTSAIICETSSSNCTPAFLRASFLESICFTHLRKILTMTMASSLCPSGFALLDLTLALRAALQSLRKDSSSKQDMAALRQEGKLMLRSPRAPTPALAFIAAKFLLGVAGIREERPLMLSLRTSLRTDSLRMTSTLALRSTRPGPWPEAPPFICLDLDGVANWGKSFSAFAFSTHASLLLLPTFCCEDRSCSSEEFRSLCAKGSLPAPR